MRKLASIKEISEVKPIFGADKIQAYRVDGWWVVDSINKYSVGDLVCYLEIDSWVPTYIAPFLSRGKDPREFNGVPGERLRTVKLKGQVSQGLLFPIENGIGEYPFIKNANGETLVIKEDQDVTDFLGIQKYEAPISIQMIGTVRRNFPSFIRKTDQTRIQSLTKEFQEWKGLSFEVSEKLNGSSMTVYYKNGDIGVCSRNLDLKEDDNNTFWKTAKQQNIIEALKILNRNIAVQGELIGEGIQKNPYKITGNEFHIYDIWDIDRQEYLDANSRLDLIDIMNQSCPDVLSLTVMSLLEYRVFSEADTIDSVLEEAIFKSSLNPKIEAEGLVFKCIENPSISFKAISNKFLLKGGD